MDQISRQLVRTAWDGIPVFRRRGRLWMLQYEMILLCNLVPLDEPDGFFQRETKDIEFGDSLVR